MKVNLSNRYLLSTFSVILLMFTSIKLYCQEATLPLKPHTTSYVFNEINLSNGEPIRDVLDLVQDKRGFVWMASRHGLLRYDGHDFKRFIHTPNDDKTIVDTECWSLLIFGDTLLLIGTSHGISIMDIRTEKFKNLTTDDKGNSVSIVNGLFKDSDGKIWMGGLNGLYSL